MEQKFSTSRSRSRPKNCPLSGDDEDGGDDDDDDDDGRLMMTLTLTWLLTVCSKITGVAAGFDLSPPPAVPFSSPSSQK